MLNQVREEIQSKIVEGLPRALLDAADRMHGFKVSYKYCNCYTCTQIKRQVFLISHHGTSRVERVKIKETIASLRSQKSTTSDLNSYTLSSNRVEENHNE